MSELSNYLSDEYDDYNYDVEDENEESEGPDLVNSNELMHNSMPSFKRLLNISLAYTPNTLLADYSSSVFDERPYKNDLILKCDKCEAFIPIHELVEHQNIHKALSDLNFIRFPSNLAELIKRRKVLIKNYEQLYVKFSDGFSTPQEETDWNLQVNRINTSFEFLKSHLEGTYINYRRMAKRVKCDAKAESIIPKNSVISCIGSCGHQNEAYRKEMEDFYVLVDSFGKCDQKTFIGVYDGFEGRASSNINSSQLHYVLLKHMCMFDKSLVFEKNSFNEWNDQLHALASSKESENNANDAAQNEEIYLNNIRSAFVNSYLFMDKFLKRGINETSKHRWSGTTCATCLIDNIDSETTWLHVANCGDVEAIAVMNNGDPKKSFKLLTRLHTLDANKSEKERIEKAGCKLLEVKPKKFTLDGKLSITRALGFHGDPSVKKYLSSTPSVKSIKMEKEFVCVVIASKGLWSVLSHDKVTEIILQCLPLVIFQKQVSLSNPSQAKFEKSEHVFQQSSDNMDKIREIKVETRPKTTENTFNKVRSAKVDSKKDCKASSDIFPMSTTNRIKEKSFDDKLNLKRFENDYTSVDEVKDVLKGHAEDLSEVFKKEYNDENIQVSNKDINREMKNLMEPSLKKRLEYCEYLTETLVNAAMLAGSTENIAVHCVLLPASGI